MSAKQRDPLEIVHTGDVTQATLQMSAILNAGDIQRVRDALFPLVDGLDRCNLLLDFRNVMHLSSAALGTFITLNKKVNATEGTLILCNLDPVIYEVFEITKLNKLLRIQRPDRDDGPDAGVGARLKPRPPTDSHGVALPLPPVEPDQ